ncbi:amino acid adenylation domain-containing protein [Kutzneria buriramensis]|nr:amino acid adenylation domain-containing protein [Kutzneria buriramensis]
MIPHADFAYPIISEQRPLAAESLVALIRGQAAYEPGRVAVEFAGGRWTYGQLWTRAERIAAALLDAGVRAGDRVALWAERSPTVIAAALAVMRLRAAYVPVDPAHPAARIAAVLAAAGPVALVHDGRAARLPRDTGPLSVVDAAEVGAAGRPADLSGHPEPHPADPAYVVFTSGSTGTPKGVIVEHGSLVNYVSWCDWLVGGTRDGSPLFASLGYDLALTSLWVPLAHGGRVVVAAGAWDRDALFAARTPRHSVLKLTPSHARLFEEMSPPPAYRELTGVLMFGGEALDAGLIRSIGDRLDGVRLVNHYGPTETTIGCFGYRFDRHSAPDLPTVPIGLPVWNTRGYVLDDQLRPTRPGEPGELVVAGRAVAAGYLGGATGGFLDERELGGGAGRAYRTGDLVRHVPGHGLVHLGRLDDQVKVNGYRIELDELRHHVLRVPGVAAVAFDIVRDVVDTVDAFVVAADTGDRDLAAEVRAVLAAALPEALVPERVRLVPEIVLSANGKCDVAATRAAAEARTD